MSNGKRLRAYLDQLAWVKDHGETLAGYVKRYGSAADANHYGDGGEAIYAADKAELDFLFDLYLRGN